jgi:hypothetical protein
MILAATLLLACLLLGFLNCGWVSALRLNKANKKQVVFTLALWERAGVRVAGSARISRLTDY